MCEIDRRAKSDGCGNIVGGGKVGWLLMMMALGCGRDEDVAATFLVILRLQMLNCLDAATSNALDDDEILDDSVDRSMVGEGSTGRRWTA